MEIAEIHLLVKKQTSPAVKIGEGESQNREAQAVA